MQTPGNPTRPTWLMIAGAVMFACMIYALPLAMLARSNARFPTLPAPAIAFYLVGGVALLGSVLVTRLFVRGPVDAAAPGGGPEAPLMAPPVFLQRSMVALAMGEAPAIVGFVFGLAGRGGLVGYLPFGLASLLVLALDVIPAGMRYWDAWESRQGTGEVPID